MALYGNYQTGEQLAEGPLTSLWEARPAGAAESEPPRFVVKVFAPSGTFLGAEGQKFDLRPFLAAAQAQAKAAAAGSHWAPIHASGQAEGGAFYVTDRFSHSLGELLDARIRLQPPALHNVFASALRGLLELHKAANRPHANLKPTNILLEGSGARARVALADPLAPGELDEHAGPAADLKALGEMLYQLVTGRPFVAKNCWPIGPSPEWSHYGDAWRGLCSRLLAPDMAAGTAELQAVAEELARLRPQAAGRRLLHVAIGLAAVALVATGAFLAWRELRRRKPQPSVPQPGIETEASDWLAQMHTSSAICRSAAVNAEWKRRIEKLIPPGVNATGLAAEPRLYGALRQQADALRNFLAALDDQQALPTALPQLAQRVPEGPVRQAAAAALRQRREAALKAILSKIPWDESGNPPVSSDDFKRAAPWREPSTAYLNWRLAAARALVACHALTARLDGGWLPDARPPGEKASVMDLLASWRKLKVPSELEAVFQPTIARAEALARVAKLDRKALLSAIASPDPHAPPQAKLLAWRRLGEFDDWPATLDELRQEAALAKDVAATAASLKKKNPDAIRWVETALPAESPRRWEKVFNAIAAKQPTGDFADKDLAAAEAIRQEAGIADDRLAPSTRLRLAIFRLRRSLRGPQQDIVKAARSSVGDVGRLPEEIRGHKEVAALVSAIERLLRHTPKGDAGQLFGTTGPASAEMGVRWTATLSPDGERATYAWPGTGHRLVFARVDVPGQPNPCYVSTTEVPVGLFIDVLTAAKGWKAIEGMLAARPKGPSVWEWVEDKGERRLRRASGWLEGFAYAPGIRTSAPTESHPIQQVSPAAAVCFAWQLGCRLPTAAEWAAAMGKAAGAEVKPNLRDKTWARQHAFLRKALAAGRKPPAWPDAGIFWPMGVPGKVGAAAEAVSAEDDGALWFQPVGSGERLSHLVGNVAELVLDMPAAEQDKLAEQVASFPPEVGGPFLRAALLRALEKNPALVGVVGGSALSAPEVWDGRARPFEKPLPVGSHCGGRRGYSDVGFRLAFTAPGEPFSVKLRRILAARGYLPALR